MPSRRTTAAFVVAESLALVATLACAVVLSRPEEWHPAALVALLGGLTLVGDTLQVRVRGQSLSGGFVAVVLAIGLLGPAPAVTMALLSALLSSARRRARAAEWLANATSRTLAVLAGAGLLALLVGQAYKASTAPIAPVRFALSMFVVFLFTNVVNFLVIALDNQFLEGRSVRDQVTEAFVPLLPGQVAAGALTALLAVAFSKFTLWGAIGTVVVLGIFHSLMRALLRSEERADQLEARSLHLASLQFGVLATLVETLALRDRSTARHAAAVGRYARELAAAAGLDERTQELAHTAGLLHDIGKFALPDRILQADVLDDADWAMIRRHPQEGATLVGRLDGYGEVAEAILYHHERIDGEGYPAGLIGSEIPLVSRIIAICSTFDALTARDSYRSPMSPQDAITELRRVAGRQLDAELVESFTEMIQRDGRINAPYNDDVSFEEELAFGRRVRELASPLM
ncbi:MAG TPA: HD domain-containing phosphohydrolase [Solirubrobacteraceae bacterium]|nr:HD domain-containing phosphohydrolase [Solirubrobacteraceae bacterium]